MQKDNCVQEIRSGAQTGADRGALDAAIQLGIPHGGYVPRGRLSEDGPVPERYQMTELPTQDYPTRTRRNIETTDGTVVLLYGTPRPRSGTALTISLCRKLRRPCIVLDLQQPVERNAAALRRWLLQAGVKILNVAGSRESSAPGIEEAARALIVSTLASTND